MYRIIADDYARVAAWVALKNDGHPTEFGDPAIGLERHGQLIAGTVYSNYSGRSICMHTAIERMNREFLWYCFYYPFVQLKLIKVLGLVDSFNSAAIRLDEHLGFRREAVVKDAGRHGDLLIYSMTAEQCRWLNVARRPGVHQYGQQQEVRYA
jgi:hypothetical protein